MATTQPNTRVNPVDMAENTSADNALCLENQVCFHFIAPRMLWCEPIALC